MDLDNIFGLFGFNKNDDKLNKDSYEKEIKEFKATPTYKVGMFYKMISNGIQFRSQIVKFFEKSTSEDLDLGLEEVGDYMMYTRAYYWIQECDLKDEEWENGLKHYLKKDGFEVEDYEKNDLIKCFILSIKYFEEVEEYEKCAFLKNIQDYLKKKFVLNLF